MFKKGFQQGRLALGGRGCATAAAKCREWRDAEVDSQVNSLNSWKGIQGCELQHDWNMQLLVFFLIVSCQTGLCIHALVLQSICSAVWTLPLLLDRLFFTCTTAPAPWGSLSWCGVDPLQLAGENLREAHKMMVESLISTKFLGVSKNRGTPEIIHFHRVFHYKPSILGFSPYFWVDTLLETSKEWKKNQSVDPNYSAKLVALQHLKKFPIWWRYSHHSHREALRPGTEEVVDTCTSFQRSRSPHPGILLLVFGFSENANFHDSPCMEINKWTSLWFFCI